MYAQSESLESRRFLSVDIGATNFFVQEDAEHGMELWKSDLDGSNVTLVKDIVPGKKSSTPQKLLSFNGTLFFTANVTDFGDRELWTSDGTEGGTKLVSEIYGGGSSSNPHDFRIVSNHLVFLANPGSGDQLYVTDGTGAGTIRLTGLLSPYSVPDPRNLVQQGNLLYYEGTNYSYGEQTERWQTDGTLAGTVISPGASIIAGVLRVFGSNGDDQIQISSSGGITTVEGAGPSDLMFNNNAFSGIAVFALAGNDDVSLGDSILTSATIEGGFGDDTILGGHGNDTITDSRGNDLLDGGAGNDFLSNNEGELLHSPDTLNGGIGNDTLRTGNGDGLLSGGDGNDSIVGGFGDETLDGGNGDDFIQVLYYGAHTVLGGDGNDTLLGQHWGLGDVLNGGNGNDSITGGLGDETLIGGAGDDSLAGGGGNDSLDAGADDPLPQAQITFTQGALTIAGTVRPDWILLRRDPDKLGALEVIIDGTVARRIRIADLKSTRIDGDDGNDSIDVSRFDRGVTINGNGGHDQIYGSQAADSISGGDGNDWISSGAGNDTVSGDLGNDRLFGGDGNDYIDAGGGIDVIRSGAGRDRIIATIGVDDVRNNAGDLVTNVVT